MLLFLRCVKGEWICGSVGSECKLVRVQAAGLLFLDVLENQIRMGVSATGR